MSWNRYATALPSIAQAVDHTPVVRLNRITGGLALPLPARADRADRPGGPAEAMSGYIDSNCDVGAGYGGGTLGHAGELMPHLTKPLRDWFPR